MNGEAKPTRVQSHCNLAYDKFTKNLNELESRKMITQDPLVISEKGRDFLQDYGRIKGFVFAMGVKYMTISEEES